MNMAFVALGSCDVYFEFGTHAWDVAAGDLLVREAGGVVIDPAGTTMGFKITRNPLSDGTLRKLILSYLATLRRGFRRSKQKSPGRIDAIRSRQINQGIESALPRKGLKKRVQKNMKEFV